MTVQELIGKLEEYAKLSGEKLVVLIVGAHALHFYGCRGRHTRDLDAEILEGDLYQLRDFLSKCGIEADLTGNFSGWSIISMPPGYRERGQVVYDSPHLNLMVLEPCDYIVAKLRRGTRQDIEDALEVAKAVKDFSIERLNKRVREATEASVPDTSLLNFRKIVRHFIELAEGQRPKTDTRKYPDRESKRGPSLDL